MCSIKTSDELRDLLGLDLPGLEMVEEVSLR